MEPVFVASADPAEFVDPPEKKSATFVIRPPEDRIIAAEDGLPHKSVVKV
jgi:hypothetical protein